MSVADKVLRAAFVLGAITDGLAVLPMLSPALASWVFGADPAMMTVGYRYAMAIGASLMAGWTVLLVWGAVEPQARRAVLVMTLFPVVTGILATMVWAATSGLVLPGRVAALGAHLGLLIALTAWGLYLGRAQNAAAPPC